MSGWWAHRGNILAPVTGWHEVPPRFYSRRMSAVDDGPTGAMFCHGCVLIGNRSKRGKKRTRKGHSNFRTHRKWGSEDPDGIREISEAPGSVHEESGGSRESSVTELHSAVIDAECQGNDVITVVKKFRLVRLRPSATGQPWDASPLQATASGGYLPGRRQVDHYCWRNASAPAKDGYGRRLLGEEESEQPMFVFLFHRGQMNYMEERCGITIPNLPQHIPSKRIKRDAAYHHKSTNTINTHSGGLKGTSRWKPDSESSMLPSSYVSNDFSRPCRPAAGRMFLPRRCRLGRLRPSATGRPPAELLCLSSWATAAVGRNILPGGGKCLPRGRRKLMFDELSEYVDTVEEQRTVTTPSI
ncbi:hypothetical protein BZA05DRAFT_416275 [Tricharina praecox]|uniref:uncharacterized protein n=1 Tax=Tricharina praecox TaxID=43433 RepID=UPI00221E3E58|nr:uncharacterized protein BZA05DRAFT_416275 [Tricharina praecox]KAI5856620.1 hypothetical protein BZA05DRAFT_416275 [Tricharina praecox]